MVDKKTTASFLVSVALAGSLGYAGGLRGAGVSDANASASPKCVSFNIPITAADKTCFEACLDSAVCPDADSRMGLSGQHTCKATKHVDTATIAFHRGRTNPEDGSALPDGAQLTGSTCHAGSWIPGAPAE